MRSMCRILFETVKHLQNLNNFVRSHLSAHVSTIFPPVERCDSGVLVSGMAQLFHRSVREARHLCTISLVHGLNGRSGVVLKQRALATCKITLI